MIQRRRFSAAIATLVAGCAFMAALPSGTTAARWSDSTTVEQPLLTTVSDAEPALPPDISIGHTNEPSDPADPRTSTGFSITPNTDVTLDGLTVRRGDVVRGSGSPNLTNHVDIDVWLTPDTGAKTCRAFAASLDAGTTPDGAVQLGGTIQHSDLNGANSVYEFDTANPMVAAKTTRSICPIITITKDSAENYAGSSFELIFRYTFTSRTSETPVSGEITTLFAINAHGTATSDTRPSGSDSTEAVSGVSSADREEAARNRVADSTTLDRPIDAADSSQEPDQAEDTGPSDNVESSLGSPDIDSAELDEVAP